MTIKKNFTVPAYLSDFKEIDSKRTVAKLKVFYKGETSDGRIFTDEFAESLATTIPYTPVVAFYDEEEKDFVGHNHTQYIYGVVRGDAEVGFEEEKGVSWLISEVMLYTDRIDNIGEVAKKIVGQPQSLEIDPDTLTYELIKVNGRRKMKFTGGSLVGLSVLGTSEQPAFTGSAFFKEGEDALKERFDKFLAHLNKERGTTMNPNLEAVQKYAEFLSLSYNQQMQLAYKALTDRYKDEAVYLYILEMAEDRVVYETYDWNDGTTVTYRVGVTVTDSEVTLAESSEEVMRVYVTAEEWAALSTPAANPADAENMGEGANNLSDGDEEDGDEGANDDEPEDEEEEETGAANNAAVPNTPTPQSDTEGAANELSEAEALAANLATQLAELTKELDVYREKEKDLLLDSYKGHIEEEELAKIDPATMTLKDLEIALALCFATKRAIPRTSIPLTFTNPTTTGSGERNLNSLVAAFKNNK